jgi:DNA polymerase III delta prime subunit
MTTQASNALLKTLEEPLPDRIIIATSSNPNYLLDTIRSRATIIQFTATDENKVSMGRPGLARRLSNVPKYQELHTIIESITEAWWTKELISTKQAIFLKAHES